MKTMASFSDEGVELNALSENNSIKNIIEVHSSRTERRVTLNEVPFSLNNNKGMGVLILNSSFAHENYSVFDFEVGADRTRFVDHMKKLPSNKVVILVSCNKLGSDENVDKVLAEYGSSSWFGSYFFTGPETYCNYIAIINTNMKAVVSESINYNNLVADASIVFDDINDIGFCGTAKPLAIDWQEYSSSNDVVIHEYVDIKLANTFIKTGSHFNCVADLKSNSNAFTANNFSTVSVNQYKDSVMIETFSLPRNTKADTWENFSEYFTISNPEVNRITVVAQKVRDIGQALTGDVMVKNLHLTQVARLPVQRSLAISVNSIRSQTVKVNPIAHLLSITENNDNVVTFKDVKERE